MAISVRPRICKLYPLQRSKTNTDRDSWVCYLTLSIYWVERNIRIDPWPLQKICDPFEILIRDRYKKYVILSKFRCVTVTKNTWSLWNFDQWPLQKIPDPFEISIRDRHKIYVIPSKFQSVTVTKKYVIPSKFRSMTVTKNTWSLWNFDPWPLQKIRDPFKISIRDRYKSTWHLRNFDPWPLQNIGEQFEISIRDSYKNYVSPSKFLLWGIKRYTWSL